MGEVAPGVAGAHRRETLSDHGRFMGLQHHDATADARRRRDLVKAICIETAERHIGDSLYAEFGDAQHAGLKPHEISGQKQMHNLSFAALQRFIFDGPSREEREQTRAQAALLDDHIAAPGAPMGDLEGLDERKIGARQRICMQRAIPAARCFGIDNPRRTLHDRHDTPRL